MKTTFYLFVCLIAWGCGSSNELVDMSSQLSIEIAINDCIRISEPTKVSFIIKNRTSKPVTIHAWHLYLSTIYSSEGAELMPHTIIEHTVSRELSEYVEIAGKSTKEIVISTEFFKAYSLDRDSTYKVVGKYDGSYSTRGKRFELQSDKVQIQTCVD